MARVWTGLGAIDLAVRSWALGVFVAVLDVTRLALESGIGAPVKGVDGRAARLARVLCHAGLVAGQLVAGWGHWVGPVAPKVMARLAPVADLALPCGASLALRVEAGAVRAGDRAVRILDLVIAPTTEVGRGLRKMVE